MNSSSLWNAEYRQEHVIPSTIRKSPSRTLLTFSELLGIRNMRTALDAGCGNGRNSLYLASLGLKVDAIDFSHAAVMEANKRIRQHSLRDRIHIREANLENALPFKAASFDLCLDLFVFCHLLDDQIKRHYVSELYRVAKPQGRVISALFDTQDEYYSRFARRHAGRTVAMDPSNGITKELYSRDIFLQWFTPLFRPEYFIHFEYYDTLERKSYRRRVLAISCQKRARNRRL